MELSGKLERTYISILENKKKQKMKTIKLIQSKIALLILLVIAISCERDISDDAVPAEFPTIGDIFIDAPVGLTDEFFISFDPVEGANVNGFGTDENEKYLGTSSIRIDVPTPNDPEGGFIGGIFTDRGEGRNLTGYDALTFWAKGTTSATIEVGFGTDFIEDKYPVSVNDLELSTGWKKYIIPIPDPSKLIQEKGMFLFSAGTQSTGGFAYTIWIDELKFERLGTIRLQNSFIMLGEDVERTAFVGANERITGLGAIFNLDNGVNRSVTAAPSYFDFESDNPSITGPFELNEFGEIFTTIIGEDGTAIITAQLANTLAEGSLTINAAGAFPHATIPTRAAENVTSYFSDAYTNVPVRHYNGFFGPPPNGFQTTQGGAGSDPNNVDIQAPFADGSLDNIINYTVLNFVSIGSYETVPLVDVSNRTHLHVDINVRENLDASDFIRILLESGTGGTTSGGSFTLTSAALGNVDMNGWASFDIPLANFPGFTDPANLGQIFFISDATISDIWVDNVYFYNE